MTGTARVASVTVETPTGTQQQDVAVPLVNKTGTSGLHFRRGVNGPPEHPHGQTANGVQDSANEERPFTDYGQFGVDMLDTRVLWQDQVWVDRLGAPHALHQMSNEYLTNVIDYLYRRAPEWHLEALLDATAELADALTHDEDADALRATTAHMQVGLAMDPVCWIDDTPLMAALRRWRQTTGSPG